MFMISLAIIFGLFFTVFAVQNTTPATLVFGTFTSPPVSIYMIILGALLLGIIIAWIFSAIDNVTTYFLLNSKEKTIRELKKTTSELIRRVHQLEVEKNKDEGTENEVSENEEL